MNSKFPLLDKFKTEFRFLLVGSWNTLFGYSIFVGSLFIFDDLLLIGSYSYLLAITCSHILGIINSFFFHKYFTFGSNEVGLEAFKEFFRFFNSYLITFILNLILIYIFVELFLFDALYAGALSIFICVIFTFFLLSKYSFKAKESRELNE